MTNFILKHPTLRSKLKQNLYKLIVARSDINAALTACRLFMKTVDRLGHELYYPLYCSIIICYARPFSDNKPLGPLLKPWRKFPDKFLQETHEDLIRARNELIAHSDLNVRKVKIVPACTTLGINNIVTEAQGVEVSSYYFELNKFNAIHNTCFNLGKRLNDEIHKELDRLYEGMDLPVTSFDLRFNEGL